MLDLEDLQAQAENLANLSLTIYTAVLHDAEVEQHGHYVGTLSLLHDLMLQHFLSFSEVVK